MDELSKRHSKSFSVLRINLHKGIFVMIEGNEIVNLKNHYSMKGYIQWTLVGLAITLGTGLRAQEVLHFDNANDVLLGNNLAVTLSAGCKVVSGTLESDATIYARGGTFEGNFKLKRLVVEGGSATAIHSAGTQMNITGGVNVTGNSTLTTGDNLVLLSDAAGTARIEELTAGNAISGEVTVQQYIPGGRRVYRFLTHPFNTAMPLSVLTDDIDITGPGAPANGFTQTITGNPSAWWLDPMFSDTAIAIPNLGWMAFTRADTALWNRYQGIYLMVRGTKGQGLQGQNYTPSAVTLDMKGDINQGQQIVPVKKGTDMGYNLIGNPYPSAVDLIPALNTMSHRNGAAFWVWNANLGTRGGYEPVLYAAGNYHLPAYSSFVVDVTADDNITFEESDKVAAGTTPLFKKLLQSDLLELKVYSDSGTICWDKLYLRSDAHSSDSLEQGDARKNRNYDLNFSAYAAGGQKLCVDSRPYAQNTIIPLSFDTKLQKDFEIRVATHTLMPGTHLYLLDQYLNTSTLLQPGASYKFSVTSDSLSAGDRFQIGVDYSFNQPGTTTTLQGEVPLSVKDISVSSEGRLYPNPAADEVYLEWPAAAAGGSVRVISAVGSLVLSGRYEGARTALQIGHLAPGVYTVLLQREGHKEQLRFVKH